MVTDRTAEPPRKRRRVGGDDDIEASYFKRLEREEEKEQRSRRDGDVSVANGAALSDGNADPSAESDDDALSQLSLDAVPQHEALDESLNSQDKLHRTVFLGNVSTEAIKSKSAKKTLMRHLQSVLETTPEAQRLGKLESIRFRSTAYTGESGPKKATFAKKELMDKTTISTNAYAVFTTVAAAEHVAEKLNGSVVLDRHLRVDCLGRPSKIDHRNCIFIGNLSFVNEESLDNTDDADSRKRRTTGKEPADAEEGLWRVFGKVGDVESVRVVRDQETRVGKGFAYVQFKSENSVEAALVMNDKKFPPMLPRKLRVMRARKMKAKAPSREPRAGSGKRVGFQPGAKSVGKDGRSKPGFVFEGHRATSTSHSKALGQKKRHSKKPTTRSSRRGAEFKLAKGKKRKEGH